jgi:hypothetical protein
MPDANPFDLAFSNRIRQRIEGIADRSKNMLTPTCSSTPTRSSETVCAICCPRSKSLAIPEQARQNRPAIERSSSTDVKLQQITIQ